jgi:hypothetical protein
VERPYENIVRSWISKPGNVLIRNLILGSNSLEIQALTAARKQIFAV